MTWTPQERAMLREMGIPWPHRPGEAEGGAAPAVAGLVVAAPVVAAPVVPATVVAAEQPARAQAAIESRVPATTPAPAVATKSEVPLPSGLDWTALQEEVSSCERCGLCRTRRQTVFGVGDPQARWMVIGEAPGEQEDRQGEPFVGPAGQLLDRMLAAIGLQRGEGVFITNTVKCRPPQNRNPQPDELAACAPVLWRQIELVKPQIILAMGRFAAQQLLSTEEAIGRLRGRVHRLANQPQVPVVVTYHPAYLLRNPADKGKAWADLCLAADTVQPEGSGLSAAS